MSETNPNPAPAPAERSRFEPLDFLRGLAVLGMGLSGMLPDNGLPAWMYHAQLPPPTHEFTQFVYGITWVDLVFPFFLFALGAAIPLALTGRANRGESNLEFAKNLVSRGLLLAAFALIGEHLRPFVLSEHPDVKTWAITLVGFALISFILIRWPASVPKPVQQGLMALGWIGSAAIIATWDFADGTHGFANYRNDVILMIMANVAVSGGLIWWITRRYPNLRWLAFGVVAGVYLTKDLPGIGKIIWDWDPTLYLPIRSGPDKRFLPILYHFEYHKYLMIVLPGMFAGELILKLPTTDLALSRVDRTVAVLVGPVIAGLTCGLLLARETSLLFILDGILLAAVIAYLGKRLRLSESVSFQLFMLGAPLLMLGLLLEPLGGGIKKDTATFSYFWVTAGLGSLMLGSLHELASTAKGNRAWRTVVETGMNPIMGYVVITNLIWGIIGLTGVHQWLGDHLSDPNVFTAWAFFKTAMVALVTAWFTRRRWFLRA